jgi:phage shock protein A
MFRRLFMVLRSWFGAGLDSLDDPERMLTLAQGEMTAMHAKNRERAVQAITQKNNLQNMVTLLEKRIQIMEGKAQAAEERREGEQVRAIRAEISSYETTLRLSRAQLEEAIKTAEQVKEAIKREETKIREKTAEAMALKAQLKNHQIQSSRQMLRELGYASETLSNEDKDLLIIIALGVVILVLFVLLLAGR